MLIWIKYANPSPLLLVPLLIPRSQRAWTHWNRPELPPLADPAYRIDTAHGSAGSFRVLGVSD